tara:strand:+ start:239 stop:952 length:714 start_codon:yes stop_codon:yes gene_type:complete
MVVKIAWLIFARAKSKRLPNKCYLKIKGLNTIERIVKNASINNINKKDIFLCTSIDESCDNLESIAKRLKINVLRGSEDYPLERIMSKDAKYKLKNYDYLVRICGDSPFYPFLLTEKSVNAYKNNSDNLFAITNIRKRNFPNGMSIEIYDNQALKNLLNENPLLGKIEHMSELISKNKPKNLKIIDIESSQNMLEILPNKLTLDTCYDYQKFCYLVENNFEEFFDEIIKSTKLKVQN